MPWLCRRTLPISPWEAHFIHLSCKDKMMKNIWITCCTWKRQLKTSLMHTSKICHSYQLITYSKKVMGEINQRCKIEIERTSGQLKTSKCCFEFLTFRELILKLWKIVERVVSWYLISLNSIVNWKLHPVKCWKHSNYLLHMKKWT